MKKFLLFAAVLFVAIHAASSQLDVNMAQATAHRFLASRCADQRYATVSRNISLVYTETNTANTAQPVYYIFNTEAGFIIVSAEDRARQILAYGDTPLDMNQIPDNMKYWLNRYKQEIEYLQIHPNVVINKKLQESGKRSRVLSVEPLLSAKWGQDAPYNNLCPIFPFADNARGLTGCAATSLSMIFHHWKYPIEPIPEIEGYTYIMPNYYYSIELPSLPSVSFNWDQMLDVYSDGGYTTEQANAVALLMRHVGQEERMQYGVSSSGAQVEDMLETIELFGYDEWFEQVVKSTTDTHGYEQELINDEDWATMIQAELSECRPILYLAYRPVMVDGSIKSIVGHAFNVDGYDQRTDTYHVNWGWKGYADGYFVLNVFNGASQLFNLGQSMIIGIEPPAEEPIIKVPPQVGVDCHVGNQATVTFNIKGRLLRGRVNLELNDDNGVFDIDATSFSATDVMIGKKVTLTYSPENPGTHIASIVLSSPGAADTTITIYGTARLETYTPVLLPADSAFIDLTSFKADWTDKTADEYVESYNLEVSTSPSVMLLTAADFGDYPEEIGNMAQNAAQYIPEGWIYSGAGLWLDGGCIEMGIDCTLKTVPLDIPYHDKVTVVVTAKNWSEYRKATLTIATSAESKQTLLQNSYRDDVFVMDCEDIDSVSITSSYYSMIQKVEVYAGEYQEVVFRGDFNDGNANYRYISGITDKSFVVDGLTPGGTYFYKVKAHYIDGTVSPWSLAKMVTLYEHSHNYPSGDVNHDGKVNIADLSSLIDYLLGNSSGVSVVCYDVDNNGSVNIADVAALIEELIN